MFKKIYIEITNVCNLKCEFCPQTKRKKQFIELNNFEEIIKKIHNYTNLVYLHVKGEPLLHPNLEDILNILEKYGLKTNITTNGTLLKEKIELLKKSKSIRQINISIHSITENKDIKENYLKEIFESVDELDDIIISYRLWNLNANKENNSNKYIIDNLEKYYNIKNLSNILNSNNSYKIKDNIFINQDIEFVWPDINNEVLIEEGRCLALKDQIAILVDGTVVPCCLDNNGDIPLGNIYKDDLEEILNSKKSIMIKNNFEKSIITCELCRTCGFLKRLELKRKK